MPLRNVATNYTFEQQRQEINLLAADVDAIANQQGTETTDSPTFNSVFLGSTLYGPTLFTIDPATHGDDTGTLVIKGNLQIDGTTTTVNSTTMTVNDLNITLADGASNAAAADGAGLTVDGAGATLNYNGTTDEWEFNKNLRLTSANLFCINVEPSNNIQLQDDKKLLCGASSDLQIFHDAVNTHSRIKNTAGQLWLQSDNGIRFTDADINQSMAAFYDNGAVELYHNGTRKFETTSSGIAIHEDTNKVIRFTGSIGEVGNVTGFQASNTAGDALTDFGIRATTLRFATGSAERLRITSDGKLGVNVTSPGCQTGGIHAVHDATEGTPSFTGGEVAIFQRNFNSAQGCHVGIIGGSSGSSSINFGDKDDADVGIIQYAHSDNSMRFYVSAAERLRILSTGGLKIGNRIIYGSLASDPTGINAGDEYYNTTDNTIKVYDGSAWNAVGSSSSVTTTISKASSHDIWCEGDGMKQSCSTTHRTGVSHSSSTTVTMTFTFSVGVGNITEFKMGLATPNNTNINYSFNNGSFTSTGHSGSTCTEIDLTSAAQSASTVTTFKLQAGNGSGNTHIYMSYWKINGTYIVGSFEDNSQQLTVTI